MTRRNGDKNRGRQIAGGANQLITYQVDKLDARFFFFFYSALSRRNTADKFLLNPQPCFFFHRAFENFGNKNLFFFSSSYLRRRVSPIGREVARGFTDIPPEKERVRNGEKGGGAGSRREKKTKRRSAPHESLIESIHGDSGEKKIARSEIRMAGGGARKCAGSLQRRGSRKRTLKSLILEEEGNERKGIETESERETEKGRDGRGGRG